MLILERDQRLLRYKKQKNEDSNIKVTDSDLRSNQTKSPKKKKKKKKKEEKEKRSKRNLSMAQQWNEEYCCQPCLARHGRENDGEYLVVSHVHDHKSTPPRHDKGDLVALGDNAHKVGGAR